MRPVIRYVLVRQGDQSNNSAPFGGTANQRYQQIYSASALSEGGRITSISFPSTNQGELPLATADYLFRLEETTLPVMGLSHRLDQNLGSGAITVLERRIEGHVIGDTLTFDLDTPFVFNPSVGNLLLDVVISNAIDDGGNQSRVFPLCQRT